MKNESEERWWRTARWAIVVTIGFELVTLFVRFGMDYSVHQFNETSPPLLLQLHHMFWAVPLLFVLPLFWKSPVWSGRVLGVAMGFVISDLVHHFMVLPVTVGNTGWHWP